MTTKTLREEIIDILKDVYYNNDQADPFDGPNDADRILKIFEKRFDSVKLPRGKVGAIGYNNIVDQIKKEISK